MFGWLKSAGPEPEKRNYTDVVTNALINAATDGASSGYVAALEIAAGQLSRAFTAATVRGVGMAAFTPDVMAQIARSLLEAGEAVYYRRGMDLIRADNYGLLPDGRYQFSMTDREVALPPRRVFHLRWAHEYSSGRGIGPLSTARTLLQLMQRLENSLATESNAAIGYLLPIPADGAAGSATKLREDLAELSGRIAVIETTRGGWGEGTPGAPQQDYKLARMGPDYPPSSVSLFVEARNSVLAACGYPLQLTEKTDGTSQREAWRRYLHGTVAPLGRLLSAAADQCGLPVQLDWDNLFASDITGRARAFQSLVGAGMDISAAAAASGILTPE